MDLLFIRHGEPGEDGSLTAAGRREAELLAGRLAKLDVLEYNVSPLARARETAEPTLRKLPRAAKLRTIPEKGEFAAFSVKMLSANGILCSQRRRQRNGNELIGIR